VGTPMEMVEPGGPSTQGGLDCAKIKKRENVHIRL
jgi:hypothetical protein